MRLMCHSLSKYLNFSLQGELCRLRNQDRAGSHEMSIVIIGLRFSWFISSPSQINISGDSRQPCLTPVLIRKPEVRSVSHTTYALKSSYCILMMEVNISETP